MRHALAILVCCALWAACGGDDGNSATLIGATCTTSDDCDPLVGVCVTNVKGGLCAADCDQPGAANECPLGSYCDRTALKSDKQPEVEMVLCLPACDDKSKCREGYECTGVSSGPGKVCRPKK